MTVPIVPIVHPPSFRLIYAVFGGRSSLKVSSTPSSPIVHLERGTVRGTIGGRSGGRFMHTYRPPTFRLTYARSMLGDGRGTVGTILSRT